MNELAVLTGNNKILINGIEIETKEYKGQRVITSYDVAKLHKREPKRVIENFQNNRGKFELGKDYFEISKDEIRKSKFSESFSKYSKNSIEILYTERGYLKLTKSFTDDLSWKIQDMLIESYFIVVTGQIQPKQFSKIELLQMQIESELENERLRIENEAQREIIKGLNGDLQPYQIEDIINRVVRVGGGNYGSKFNEIYRVFKEQYHIDLKARMNNYNKTVRAKDRFKSVLKYALANDYGKDLLKVVTRLYPESVRVIMDGINRNTGLGNNEVLLLN
ncbi:hypothetical protein JMUB4039_0452 [Leptotrichia trevisanii]|uniref:ORF6N domain-containing protein n=1 Tax=Leptotrichia trevisanii TaxID=109328 RepID=UPI00118AB93E|nr:ORF6N domain-containing protein [Leptotrichia trevisanii]BBM56485.1 hypothetical protein JMUB4039_0452 [Leptotrichia trevisanii]